MTRTSRSIWIDATSDSVRSGALYGRRELARGLLRWAAWSARGERTDIRVFSERAEVLEIAEDLGLTPVVLEAGQTPRERVREVGASLVLAPARGPVSPERIRRLLTAAENRPGWIVSSAGRVPPNRHPAWCNSVPSQWVQGPVLTIQEFTANHLMQLSPEARRKLGLDSARIEGSQWLPGLHEHDGALAAYPGSEANGEHSFCDDPAEYGDLPLFYRLPILLLGETQEPRCDWSRMTLEILFRPLD